jgi:hypothetical protein
MPFDPVILPPDFDEEERLEFLINFLNPNLDHFQVANASGLCLSQHHAYVSSDEFQKRLTDQVAIAELRAKAVAKIAQPKAIAALENILDSYTDAERNELVDDGTRPHLKLRAHRQRHRESARRAAWLLLKVSGAIPTALAARARPVHDSAGAVHDSARESEPAERAESLRELFTALTRAPHRPHKAPRPAPCNGQSHPHSHNQPTPATAATDNPDLDDTPTHDPRPTALNGDYTALLHTADTS